MPSAHLQAARLHGTENAPVIAGDLAPADLNEAIIRDGIEALDGAGYLRGRSAVKVHGTLYRLLGRARPTRDEADILRGMTKQLLWWFKERAP